MPADHSTTTAAHGMYLSHTLSIVGRGWDVASKSGPIGVDMLARIRHQLVRVSSKVVALGLEQDRITMELYTRNRWTNGLAQKSCFGME